MMLLVNMPPTLIRALLKGSLRGLGLQNRLLRYHVFVQIGGMTVFMYVFGFHLESTKGLFGLWLSNFLSETLLIFCYLHVMYERDWHEISKEAIIRIAAESKNAGCL